MLTKLFSQYKQMILYAFFGGCTTLVNLASYYVISRRYGLGTMAGTLIAWWVAVLFAYITNRKLVFRSQNTSIKSVFAEFVFFVGCRLLTVVMDMLIMYLFADRLGVNDLVIKMVSNLLVILCNYIASRLFIFKKHVRGR